MYQHQHAEVDELYLELFFHPQERSKVSKTHMWQYKGRLSVELHCQELTIKIVILLVQDKRYQPLAFVLYHATMRYK
jgi:hypothetical protein